MKWLVVKYSFRFHYYSFIYLYTFSIYENGETINVNIIHFQETGCLIDLGEDEVQDSRSIEDFLGDDLPDTGKVRNSKCVVISQLKSLPKIYLVVICRSFSPLPGSSGVE